MIHMSNLQGNLSRLLELKIKIIHNQILIHEYLSFLQLKNHGNHIWHEKLQLLMATVGILVEYN